jgi:hypothetical protein
MTPLDKALLDKVGAAFAQGFGSAPDLVARAPGRVNLIGEHTDYNDGFVLPCAIGPSTMVAASRRDDNAVHVVAVDFDSAVDAFDLKHPIERNTEHPWADYIRGMIMALQNDGHALTGANIAIAGNVPKGAGLSSSASLEVAVGKAMLAFEPMSQLKSLSRHLQACSPRTLIVPAEFLREMERIREQGYAVNRGEWRESVGGVAAPVRDPGGTVIAAIGVSGPIERLRPARLKSLSADLIQAADGITAALRGDARPALRTTPSSVPLNAPLRQTPKKARLQ